MKSSKTGFTLIEMSIVMLIIGLIIGGILTGRDLITAAKIRATVSQIEKYNTAVRTFQLKYNRFLPGDIPDPYASQFGFVARGAYAGEGDGNDVIEGIGGHNPNWNSATYQTGGETAMFWVDLSTAGLIKDSFNTATPITAQNLLTGSEIDLYLPKTPIRESHITVSSRDQNIGGVTFGTGVISANENYFQVANITQLTNIENTYLPSFTVSEAHNLDKKLDDGLPQFGKVIAAFRTFANYYVGPITM